MNPRKMIIVGVISAMLLVFGVVVEHNIWILLFICVSLILGLSIGGVYEWIHEEKRMDWWEDSFHKMEVYYKLLIQWLSLKQEGKNLKEFLDFNGYHSVAIYGLNEAGERLIEELEDTDIDIKYVVDRNAKNIITRLPKYLPDEELPEVDVMIVTAVLAFQEIQEEMEKKVAFPIVSLEDLVYGLA